MDIKADIQRVMKALPSRFGTHPPPRLVRVSQDFHDAYRKQVEADGGPKDDPDEEYSLGGTPLLIDKQQRGNGFIVEFWPAPEPINHPDTRA